MKDRPHDDGAAPTGPDGAARRRKDAPPGAPGAAARASGVSLASAFLDLWDRNQSELARHGPSALTDRAAAAAAQAAAAKRPKAAPKAAPPPALTVAAVTPPPFCDPEPAPSPMPAPDDIAPHRRGRPSPLVFHLAAAAASSAQAAGMAPLAADPRFPWTRSNAVRGAALGEALAEHGALGASALVSHASLRDLTRMLDGIAAWQRHPWRRDIAEPPTIWRRGAARILDYGATDAAGRDGPPVLVIPSLVNRGYVLDLHPRRSMLRWLAAQGLRPLLLDWGQPGMAERDFTLSDYVRLRLAPALEAARMHSPDGSAPALVGYCMGGTLAAAVASAGRDRVSRLALIGSPWDFSAMQGIGGALIGLAKTEDRVTAGLRLDAIGSAFGALPVDALQLAFATLDPTLASRKFRALAAMDQGGPRAEMFAATEDWLNDGVTLAIPAAKELLFDWYLDNAVGRGVWAPEGAPVRPRAIAAPTLAFCSNNDRIAPSACAEALPLAIPRAQVLRPSTGHVGMIIGSEAERQVWRPLASFLGAQ
jgi:polyhydroxyalkanoate synthase